MRGGWRLHKKSYFRSLLLSALYRKEETLLFGGYCLLRLLRGVGEGGLGIWAEVASKPARRPRSRHGGQSLLFIAVVGWAEALRMRVYPAKASRRDAL